MAAKFGGRLGIHSDGLRDLVGAAARGLHGECHLMRARLGEGMRRVLSRAKVKLTKSNYDTAAALAKEIHEQVFAAKIDLSSFDLDSLDGSSASSSANQENLKEFLLRDESAYGY